MVYHRMGLEENAIEDLSKAEKYGCRNALMFSERALAFRALGNMAQAIEDLTIAIEVGGLQTKYLSDRARCLLDQSLYSRAEADLCKALELDARSPSLLYQRGLTLYAQERYAEAVADLKAALQFDPEESCLADLYYHLGVSYANIDKHPLAVPAYDHAVSRRGDMPHYRHERAKSLQAIADHTSALRDFTRVLDLQPTNAHAFFRRAFSYKAMGLYSEAAEDFEAAKEFAPDDPRMIVNYRRLTSINCVSLGPCGRECTAIVQLGVDGTPQQVRS